MSLISFSDHDDVALLRMNDGVTNPISPGLVDELSAYLQEIQQKEYKGMVLAGGEKFFSIGLDLPGLLKLDRQEAERFIDRFHQVLWQLLTLPMPTACAMCGHAIAGGTLLALMTDYRFIKAGKTLMGVNEIKLGLVIPYLAEMMLRLILPDSQAKEMIFGGEFYPADQTAAMGLVDQLCEQDACEQAALDKINALAKLPSAALAGMKKNRLESVTALYESNRDHQISLFKHFWFKPETQELLRKAAEKF